MTARYTYAEFQAAGLTPNSTCDGFPRTLYDTDLQYWNPCAYHEGYIEGYADSLIQCSTPSGKEPAEKEEA